MDTGTLKANTPETQLREQSFGRKAARLAVSGGREVKINLETIEGIAGLEVRFV